MSDEIAEVLAEAREYIETNGWYQGEFLSPEDGEAVCALGGLFWSQELDPVENQLDEYSYLGAAAHTLARAAGVLVHNPEDCRTAHHEETGVCDCAGVWIVEWNDMSETTMQEVLDAFAKAEKIERMGYDPDLGYS